MYWCDQQTRRRSACGLHLRRSSASWLNAQVYYTLVDCNPLTPLLRFFSTSRTSYSYTVIAKFHYTGPTGPDRTGPNQTKSAHFVGDRLNSTTRAQPDPTGPARTFLRPGSPRNSVGSVRVSNKVRAGPCGSARVRSGPCSGI